MAVNLFLVGSVVAILLLVLASARGSGWNDAFGHVARRCRGMLHTGSWFQPPSVQFTHGDAAARLTVATLRGSGGQRCVQLAIQQREITSRTEIYYYQNRDTLLPLRRGLLAMEFDWEDFRHRWHVLAEDGEETRRILSDGVRLAIEMLWRQPTPAEMSISLSRGWLVVRKLWYAPRGVELELFVERAIALSDQVNLACACGIEFVAGDVPQLLDDARCGVCGENLTSQVVVCRRCNTPHHRDCWQYGGGCATYGCGGRECLVPGVAPLTGPHFGNAPSSLVRPAKPR